MLNLALLFPNPLDRYIVLPSFKVSVQFTDFGFPSGSVVNNSPEEDTGDSGSTPGLGRSPGEGNGNPLQYFCLDSLMDKGSWRATVHGATKSWTGLEGLSRQLAIRPIKCYRHYNCLQSLFHC